jgi:hypothetical protein
MNVYEKGIPGRQNSKGKGVEVGVCCRSISKTWKNPKWLERSEHPREEVQV